ncbi:MAG: M42 family metallopeptidase [Patescibacteria group bacterium]|jgi:endoglucanase
MEQKSLDFLKQLINTPSPSGFEDAAAKVWRDYLGDAVYDTDVYCGSYAVAGFFHYPTIMLSGHIDEVGFMVNYINSDGFVYVDMIGGVDPTVAVAKRVTIHNKNGPISGVFGKTAIHLLDKEDKAAKLHQMFIDIGAKNKADALKMISIGDPITFDVSFEEYPNNLIVGRGLDDRIGAWCVAEAITKLREQRADLKCHVIGAATIQEENGIYGAKIAVEKVKPDIAIAIDVTHATDSPGISKEKCGDVRLGDGPSVNIGSTSHPKLNQMLIDTAERNNIPLQMEASPRRSGTDADECFRARGGIPTANISVPNRYMHTPVEMISLDDLENTVKLLVKFCLEYQNVDFRR